MLINGYIKSKTLHNIFNPINPINLINPIPVAVGLLPFDIKGDVGLLIVQRAIKPFIGEYAFPGGFVDWTESWKQAISREILEETTICTNPEEFELNNIYSTPDNTRILIFGMTKKIRTIEDMKNFKANHEVSALVVGTNKTKLCFSLHQTVYDDFFNNKNKYLFE
jgi:ADP-ribose pyrophosphatase YjhB (NUDIX family)